MPHTTWRWRAGLTVVAIAVTVGLAAPAGAEPLPTTTNPTTTTTLPKGKLAAAKPAASTSSTTKTPGSTTTTLAPADVASGKLERLLPTLAPLSDTKSMATLSKRYSSLSTALVGFYAKRNGVPVDAFVKNQAPALASSFSSPTLLTATAGVTDTESLNRLLVSSGAGSDPRGLGLNGWVADLSAKPGSLDAQVVGAGGVWAQKMSALRAPALAAPNAGSPQMPDAPTAAFGMLFDRSLTAMVTDHPDLFAQVSASGIGSPEASAAWNQSMVNAVAASAPDSKAGMLNPCYSDLMTTMATGVAATSSGCGDSCATAGLYLHGHMATMFDPSRASSAGDPGDSLLPPAEFNSLPDWQRELYTSQNPSLSSGLDASLGGGGACGNVSAGGALGDTLPGVFSALGH